MGVGKTWEREKYIPIVTYLMGMVHERNGKIYASLQHTPEGGQDLSLRSTYIIGRIPSVGTNAVCSGQKFD